MDKMTMGICVTVAGLALCGCFPSVPAEVSVKKDGGSLSVSATSSSAAPPSSSSSSSVFALEPMSKPKAAWSGFAVGRSFTAMAPMAPLCQEEQTDAVRVSSCSFETPNSVMLATASSLPSRRGDKATPLAIDKALAAAMEAAAKNMGGSIASSSPVDLPGAKGLDFIVKTAEGEVKGRILMAPGMFGQALSMPKGDPAASKAETDRFIKSLAANLAA